MMNIDPFHEWWKMSSYTKWYHYFWGMPLIAITICILWVAIVFLNFIYELFNGRK